ncbi:hypothetical protein WR25_20926 [Diploscapter pachys]|uniref:Yip1 domain-containing protein n=1 Tax=Diploscapter pachys TaxID=2018661 RepID=A0A2A2KAK2_9BILA|nr:hypothetical protein WR25_20926 [Diploscapter pachys]
MDDLNFTSFANDFVSVNSTNEQGGAGSFSGSISDGRRLVNNDDAGFETQQGRKGFFNLTFYQQYFDVDTDQVVKRLLNSVVPTHKNFITDFIQPIPDLWGPFWVSVTLVFSIGIFGNLAQFIENEGGAGEYGSDFRLVTSASTMIFFYVIGVPLALFALSWYRQSEFQYPFIDLLCAYGYSLTIFIPVSILWTIDWNLFRWILILVAVSLSGTVLAKAIWPSFQNDPNKLIAFGTIFMVVFLHFLLAFSFKEYFFDAMHPAKPGDGPAVPVTTQLPAAISDLPKNPAGDKKEQPQPEVKLPEKASQVLLQPDQNKSGDSGKPGKEENKDAKKPAEEAKDKPAAEKKDDASKKPNENPKEVGEKKPESEDKDKKPKAEAEATSEAKPDTKTETKPEGTKPKEETKETKPDDKKST